MKPNAIEPHVRKIRERYAAGGVTQDELAEEYQCTRQAIGAALSGLTYGDEDTYGKPPAAKPKPGTDPVYCECGRCGLSYKRHVVPGQMLRFRYGVCAACAAARFNAERMATSRRTLH